MGAPPHLHAIVVVLYSWECDVPTSSHRSRGILDLLCVRSDCSTDISFFGRRSLIRLTEIDTHGAIDSLAPIVPDWIAPRSGVLQPFILLRPTWAPCRRRGGPPPRTCPAPGRNDRRGRDEVASQGPSPSTVAREAPRRDVRRRGRQPGSVAFQLPRLGRDHDLEHYEPEGDLQHLGLDLPGGTLLQFHPPAGTVPVVLRDVQRATTCRLSGSASTPSTGTTPYSSRTSTRCSRVRGGFRRRGPKGIPTRLRRT